MDERRTVARELQFIGKLMKELEISYEQYFAGVQKREPLKAREVVSAKLRQFSNRRIIQTDLRYQYQNMATRFHSYASYWERILRMIEEGRYSRQQGVRPKGPTLATKLVSPELPVDEIAQILFQLEVAAKATGSTSPLPKREQIASFLDSQKGKIRQKFGDRKVTFTVAIENGKPKIKVKAQK